MKEPAQNHSKEGGELGFDPGSLAPEPQCLANGSIQIITPCFHFCSLLCLQGHVQGLTCTVNL